MWRIPTLIAICFVLEVVAASPFAAGAASRPATVAPALPGAKTGTPGPGMFLVARRSLDDPRFGQSIVYLVEHDPQGTLGLIVNRSSDASLSAAVPDLEPAQAGLHRLYYGGPVGLPMILMLIRGESAAPGMAHVADDVYVSTDRGVLERLIEDRKPANQVHFYVGYSGWAAGQLDFEILRDDWYVVAADTDAIFSSETDSLWKRLIEQLEPSGIQVERPPLPIMALAHAQQARQWSPGTIASVAGEPVRGTSNHINKLSSQNPIPE